MSSRTRTLVITGGLVALIVVVGLLAANTVFSSASAKTVTRTTTVGTATVQSTVTATGNVSPATSLSLNFPSSGVVTAVDVQPGAQVVAGQTLAAIDDTQTQAALSSAQASLSAAQANLANVEQPITPTVAAQDGASLQSAQQAVVTAQTNVTDAEENAGVDAVGLQATVNQAVAQLNRDTNQYAGDQATCATPTTSSGTGSGSGGSQSCAATLIADQNVIAKDNAAITNAQQQQNSGQLKDQQSLQSAQNGLVSAQDSLNATVAANNAKAAATPASVASAQSQVTSAQANLVMAQKNQANTILTAPIAGTVAAVNGAVGQTVAGGGTSSGSAAGSSATGSSSGSSAFITLDDVSTLEVVAGFAEVDAVKVQNGQQATVTLDALPNQTITGQVSNVDIQSTVVSDVVTYNVTITLTNPPSGVKPGMTANVGVVVGEADNVLELPTADITTRGALSTVILDRSGKQIVQTVTTGLVGDETTQILSGLSAGDTVVAPTVSITTGTGATGTGGTGAGRAGGGLGGGGGGGFFGGGAG